MTVLALIPARGGSKGLPGKNLRPLLGLPLLAHSIEQARRARHVHRVCVSTDDPSIAEAAIQHGAEVIHRPAALSGDSASSESALLHALDVLRGREQAQPELVCFLQCTSPVREPGDIDAAIERLRAEQADSLLSVSPSHRFLWQRRAGGEGVSINYDWAARPRRQDMVPQFVENGSIYLFRPDGLRATGNRLHGRIALHEMGEHAALEIDSALDFQLVEAVMAALASKGVP
ncbi:MAG: hypothetical protein RLZZ598_1348 [Pseudomonadota bacterium]|jgi:CMP-N,N'-diacetyllegionaminic acid synthase